MMRGQAIGKPKTASRDSSLGRPENPAAAQARLRSLVRVRGD
jgi:hypothetical protein